MLFYFLQTNDLDYLPVQFSPSISFSFDKDQLGSKNVTPSEDTNTDPVNVSANTVV